VTGRVLQADWDAPPGIEAGTTTILGDDTDLPAEPLLLQQVHGNAVVSLAALRAAAEPLKADAVTGEMPGDLCVVQTADCLPLLMVTRDGSEIAAAHAGWRGLAAGVVENTVAALRAPASEVLVWLGPAISVAAFEVGDEVRDAFTAHDEAAASHFTRNGRNRWQADLYGLARQRLADAGVSDISGGGMCTYLDRERFYSYRRDPGCGRLLSFVYKC